MPSLAAGAFGCMSAPYGLGLKPSFTPAMPVSPAKTSESKPVAPDSKPARFENDHYERHPAQWRKKLRAKYA